LAGKDKSTSGGGQSPSGRAEKNLDVSSLRLPQHLRALRARLNLTQADLAHKAGLTPRTVRDIERGRRKRVQEKTLVLLAEALGTTFEELIGPLGHDVGAPGDASASAGRGGAAGVPGSAGASSAGARPAVPAPADSAAVQGGVTPTSPAASLRAVAGAGGAACGAASKSGRKRSRAWRCAALAVSAAVVLVSLTLAARGLRTRAIHSATWATDGGTLTVYDGLLGLELWSREADARINFCRKSPWTKDVLLVGRRADTPEGGRLVALSTSSGDTLWEVKPRTEPFFAAFDSATVGAACFDCVEIWPSDIDGDGLQEIVAYFKHTRYYPSCLCLIDRDGTLLRQYCHRGFLYAFCIEDLDDDGKDEVLAGGIINASAYRGGSVFVLDENHWAGASVDSLSPAVGAIGDSCLVRAVFPRFDDVFMTEIGDLYIGIHELKILRSEDNRVTIDAVVGARRCDLLLILDRQLRPLSVDISDEFLSRINAWPDSLKRIPNPSDPGWRRAWLAKHRRYQYGL